jgi:chemotaxis protein methyltransferase CheR
MSDLPLTPPVFAILSSLIEDRIGLCYGPDDRDLLAGKLSERAAQTGFESLLDYYYFLRYGPDSEREFDALANALVVNETFFFRELGPLEVLVSQLIAPLVEAGSVPRIWCAACSTGEEPLTVAMLLAERGLLGKVELIASDISETALDRARAGEHRRRSLRIVPPPALAAKWLDIRDDAVLVHETLREAVQWRRLNILDKGGIQALGLFDVILCRNVLIYFRDITAVRVVDDLAAQLRPNGLLAVGVSESLTRFGTALACQEIGGAFLYRKVAK